MNELQKRRWLRVDKENPCRICEHTDWCSYSLDPTAGSCCMRAVDGGKLMKNGGYFYPFDESKPLPPPPKPAKERPAPPNFGEMMRKWSKTIALEFNDQCRAMGVSVAAMQWLGAVWAEDRKAMAFPMYDATCHNGNRPIGIRLRVPEGKKFAVTGSSSGIFYPYGCYKHIPSFDRLYICEGPTDTSAALDMGCFAIGRAACRGGEGYVLSVLDQLQPDDVVIVTDNDGPGVAGARDLIRHIKQPTRMLTPPTKDLRSFRQNGGTKELLEDILKNIVRK